jgi:sec-independent protein translocase protein TatA
MEFFGIGVPEIALILVVALVVFGPERLPEIAREAGKMVRQFRQMTSEATSEIRSLTGDLDSEIKSAATMIKQEVTSVKNEVTGTFTEQYKVTYEAATSNETETTTSTATVTSTVREISDEERDEFNRRKMEEFALREQEANAFSTSPGENLSQENTIAAMSGQSLIESAVEDSPATSNISAIPAIYTNGSHDNISEVNQSVESIPITVPVSETLTSENGTTVQINRPKPRISRRSAYGANRHREQEQ